MDAHERNIQSRILALLLVIGTVLASVIPVALIPILGAQTVAAPILGLSAAALGLAGVLIHTGHRRSVEIATLVLSSAGLFAAAYATGGLASPVLPLLLLLPAESFRLRRTSQALKTGFAAALAVAATLGAAQFLVGLEPWRGPGGEIASMVVVVALGVYGAMVVQEQLRRMQQTDSDAKGAPEHADPIALMAKLPGLVSLHDMRGHLVSASGTQAQLLLDRIGELSGRGMIEHMHVSDRIRFLQAIDQLRTGCETQRVDVRMRKLGDFSEDEQFLHLSMHLAAIRENGELTGFVAQSIDNAAGVELRHQLASKSEEAVAANEAKTRFLAAVSHELRTPLNAILGFSDLLSGEFLAASLSSEQREYVGLIRQSGQHLLDVINSMLDLTKIEAGRYELNPETFNVSEVIDTCESMLTQQARGKNIVLNTRVVKGDVRITACRRALQQILINLMANAIKFTEDNGVVSVDATEQNGWIVLTVADTGIGIAQSDLEKIGAPFVQVESQYARQYEGSGLGLSLVKGLVALHGGHFTIESALKVGTTVTVCLPVDGPDKTDDAVDAATKRAVEFPPRLTRQLEDRMEARHGQAKTA
ncbi:MAG: HAMP domain-containing sensor histidine kinase [Pseudomonadota bacterium]